MSQPSKKRRLPQLTLLLRCAGGAYLLYLAWDLRAVAFAPGGGLYLAALIVFALAGAALLILSGPPLARGEFLRPGESEPIDEDDPQDER